VDIAWADVLRAALSFFLVIVGIGIAYVCFRLGGVLRRMSMTVARVTDEVVPILSRAQTTVDGINLELQRVDEILVSAVNATKGAEKTVTSLSNAVTGPAKKASGFAAAAKEAMATFRAKRAESVHVDPTPGVPPEPAEAPAADPRSEAAPPEPQSSEITVEEHAATNGSVPDVPPELLSREHGPSLSQISWALPKQRS
jgi:hypothetical protein